MTKGIDRKVLQRVRSESEQNERLLGRVIVTALSTCGTLVGWMLLSQSAQVSTEQLATDADSVLQTVANEEVPAYTSDESANVAPMNVDFAPIPTLPTMPELQPVPTLMPYVAQPIRADGAPVQNDSTSMYAVALAPADSGGTTAQAPAPAPASDMPVLRVVTQPTPPVIKVVPKPAAPQPANPRPAPSGNSGGSK